jgi:FXSXX-COOH protein
MSEPKLDIASLVDEVASMDESALVHALRRVHAEAAESGDPIAAFGAFNQHSSSPW